MDGRRRMTAVENEALSTPVEAVEAAAECMGVKVPSSRFVHKRRAQRINAGRYERQEIRGALRVVREGDVVLEVGAGIGLVGAVIAAKAKPAQVVSFEANPHLMPVIRSLYNLNGLNRRISVSNGVLVCTRDGPTTLPFYLRSSYLGSSLSEQGAGRTRERVDVPTVNFSDVLAKFQPAALVMDIEGGEQAFLRDADLSGFRAVVMEFHPKAYGIAGMHECKALLRNAGFRRIDEVSTKTVWACIRPEV